MNEAQVRGVVVAHASMAIGLVDAVRSITGVGPEVLVPISNSGLAPNALADRVRALCTGSPMVVFTDLPSGSCGFAARLLCREMEGLAVISGVNLPMLLDFVTNRHLQLPELTERLVTKARTAISNTTSARRTDGDPAVSR
jgi:mannose/fructose-specific phosphotransferase system component IIA